MTGVSRRPPLPWRTPAAAARSTAPAYHSSPVRSAKEPAWAASVQPKSRSSRVAIWARVMGSLGPKVSFPSVSVFRPKGGEGIIPESFGLRKKQK